MRRLLLLPMLLALCLPASCTPTTARPGVYQGEIDSDSERLHAHNYLAKMERLDRIYRVGWPILRGNVELCPDDAGFDAGIWFLNQSSVYQETFFGFPLEDKDRDGFIRAHGLDEKVRAIAVAGGGPAARAGLKPGDAVLAWNGHAVDTGKDGLRAFRKSFSGAVRDGRTVTLTVDSGQGPRDIAVVPERICRIPLRLETTVVANAYADGREITVTSGMLTASPTDDLLAVTIGHEMGHHIMKHRERKSLNAGIGSVGDAILSFVSGRPTRGLSRIGAQAFSQEYEQEADYVGFYLAARAGYNIAGTESQWLITVADDADGRMVDQGTSHPAYAERMALNRAYIREVLDKKARGEPLVPNIRR